MIDNKPGLSIDQYLLVKQHVDPEISTSEIEARGRKIEEVSKAGSEDHKAALRYLEEQFSQQALSQKIANDGSHQKGLSSGIAKPDDKPNHGSQTPADKGGLTAALAGAEGQSDKEAETLAKAEADNEGLSASIAKPQDKPNHKPQTPADSNGLTVAIAGAEGQSDKEADTLAKAEADNDGLSASIAKPQDKPNHRPQTPADSNGLTIAMAGTEAQSDQEAETLARAERNAGGVHTDEFGNTVIIPSDNNSGNTAPDANIDEGFTHPVWQDPPYVPYPDGFDVRSLYDGDLDSSSLLTKLALIVSDAMRDAVENRIEANRELVAVTNALQQEGIQIRTEDQIEQLEKAEQASRAGNCISIIVTVLVTLLTIALAIASGGTLSSLIGLGIAAVLLVVDMSMSAAGETPLSALMMEPLMSGVIMPVIQAIADVISDLLQSLGVDEGTADLIGMIMGAVVVAVAIIAMVLLAKNSSALSSFMSKITDKLMKALGHITPELAKKAGAAIGGQATRLMTQIHGKIGSKAATQTSEEAVQQFMERSVSHVSTAMIMTSGGGGIGSSAASAVGAGFHRDLTITQSEIEEMIHQMLMTNEDLQKLVEHLREMYEQTSDIVAASLDSAKGESETAQLILNNMSVGV